MNADWVLNALIVTTGATTGWYLARLQNEVRRLRKLADDQAALLAAMDRVNGELVELTQRLIRERDRERADDWWKGN
jgi:hypothetical protein